MHLPLRGERVNDWAFDLTHSWWSALKWTLISQGGAADQTLGKALTASSGAGKFDRLDVAVAYATLPGVKALDLAVGGIPQTSRWVVGLDDAISQPEALEYIAQLPGSELRVVKLTPTRRFHPKMYLLWSSTNKGEAAAAIGSGNMTLNGLRKNGETAVVLTAEAVKDANALKRQWREMWDLGHSPSNQELADYKELFKKAKKQRKKVADLGAAPLEPDPTDVVGEESTFDGSPESAKIAWLEVGSANAGGRDLEFPKAMMPYFGLNGSKEKRKFITVDGQEHTLVFTKREQNDMWRLMFNTASIQSAVNRITMRPASGANRSDLAVVFRKRVGTKKFDLQLLKIASAKFKIYVKQSKNIDAQYVTTKAPGGRRYGYI